MRSPELVPRPDERIPQELQQILQWVNWRNDDCRKVPVNPNTLRNAGVNWPETWSSFGHARQIASQHALGLGFVITEDDPYTCVDLDNCIDHDGQIDVRKPRFERKFADGNARACAQVDVVAVLNHPAGGFQLGVDGLPGKGLGAGHVGGPVMLEGRSCWS